MGDEFGFRSKTSSTENILVTTRDVLAETPSRLYDQLHDDLRDPAKLAKVTAVSAGLGFGTTVLLTKAPKVGGYVVAGLAAYQGIRYGMETLDFLGQASDASTDYQRRMLVDRYSRGLAHEGATMIEASPGLVLGGSLAVKAVGTPPAFKAVGSFVERNTPTPVKGAVTASKEFVAEQWAFRGPGKMPLPAHILTEEGKVNALEVSDMLTGRHPWTGVETGRSIDLLSMKVSKPIKGTPESIDFGFRDKPGRLTFHTHSPDSPIGTRPGKFDLLATQDVGIVARGKQTAFFVGQAREYNAAVAAGAKETFAPKLQALVLDSERQTAFTLESVWMPKLSSWQPAVPRFVDYKTARQALTKLDITKPWQQIGEIPVLPSIRNQNVDLSSMTWLRTGVVH